MDEPIRIQYYSEESNAQSNPTTHRPPSNHTNSEGIGKVRGQHTRSIQSRLTAPQKLSTKSLESNYLMEAAQVRY